ncbi:MAG TPA: STAS domain-containing protein [Bryobacteraceae bacterium]|jgi:anti-sigma B factor antagonist|nr:STAS domain-containing protein [Bryobacteraceae bacterium]
MSLEIQQRDREGVLILDLNGRLTVGPEVSIFRDRMQKLIDTGSRQIVLDLQQVDYIDSTGLGALVMCYTSLQRAGGAVKLLNLSRRGIQLLVMTKLTTIFEVFDDEQNAINSFFPDRELKRFDILSFVQQHKDE